jgi:hypothetical protein
VLNEVKAAVRVKSDAFNDEIQGLISACKIDLRLAGVDISENQPSAGGSSPAADDPLITQAVVFYAKANFGYNDDSEKYQKAYEHLKCALSLAGDYRAVG